MLDRNGIIELFTKPRPTYESAEVVRLVGQERFARALEEKTFTQERDERGTRVIPWEDVAQVAWEDWTPRLIDSVLPAATLPEHHQQRRITLSLPKYLFRVLSILARQDSVGGVTRNASDVVERALHDLANALNAEDEQPDLRDALAYPYYQPRPTGLQWLRCRYCTTSITEQGREVCTNCQRRHATDAP